MFDHSSTTNINATPDAATATPPVRIALGDAVYWLRPSNVLRVEASAYSGGRPKYLIIYLSDGKQISELCQDMKRDEFLSLADSICAKLWPSDPAAAES